MLAVEPNLEALRRDLDTKNGWVFQQLAWEKLSTERQVEVRDRLVAVAEAIEEAIQADGPQTKGMGSLGGLLRLTSSFAEFVGNRQLYRSWVVYD